MKRLLLGIIMLTAIVSLTACSLLGKNGSTYFDTPLEAVQTFFKGLDQKDLELIEKTYGIDIKMSQYDFDKDTELLGMYTVRNELPADSSFIEDLNKMYVKGRVYDDLRSLMIIMLSDFEPYMDVPYAEYEDDVDDFTEDLNDLGAFELINLFQLEDPNDRYEDISKDRGEVYGAKKVLDCIGVFEYDGDAYFCGFQILEYEDGYIIDAINQPFAMTMGIFSGVAVEEIVDDIDDLEDYMADHDFDIIY